MGGGHKGLIELQKKPLCLHVIDRLTPQVGSVILNVNTHEESFTKFELPLVKDSLNNFVGPLGGVLAGMDWAFNNDYEYIVTAAADTPFFPLNLVENLRQVMKKDNYSIVMASTIDCQNKQNIHPTFGLWKVNLREDLRKSLNEGVRKMVAWTDRHSFCYSKFPSDNFDCFFNINNPEDLKKAKNIIDKGWV
jgi:molybdopterin-guanine dinucleotide biosynthesis protein A